MALTVFFALCILGIDFMIYVLFQWTWGDKRRFIARQVAAHRRQFDAQSGPPSSSHRRKLFPTHRAAPAQNRRISFRATPPTRASPDRAARGRTTRAGPRGAGDLGPQAACPRRRGGQLPAPGVLMRVRVVLW